MYLPSASAATACDSELGVSTSLSFLTSVGTDDWFTMCRLARRRNQDIVSKIPDEDCSTRRWNSDYGEPMRP